MEDTTSPDAGRVDIDFSPAPSRDAQTYGARALQNQIKCSQLARDFFRLGVGRAKEQNKR